MRTEEKTKVLEVFQFFIHIIFNLLIFSSFLEAKPNNEKFNQNFERRTDISVKFSYIL